MHYVSTVYGPACKFLILIAYAQSPLNRARGLALLPYFPYIRGEGFGETSRMSICCSRVR